MTNATSSDCDSVGRAMRVVYLVSLFPSWTETFIVREIAELLRLGVDVRIISLKREQSGDLVQSDAAAMMERVMYPLPEGQAALAVIGAVARDPGQAVKELAEIFAHFWRTPVELTKTLAVWWRTLALMPAVRGLRADHLHAHYATFPSTAAMVLADRLGLPFSFTSHAHDIFEYNHLLARKLKRSAFSVTISEFNRRYIAEHVPGGSVASMHIVHCGVRLADFPYRRDGRDPQQILAVGRLDDIKGFPVLLEACHLLRARGVDVHCTILGEGPQRPAIEAQRAALGLVQLVSLPGATKQEAVRKALYGASAFVQPSVVSRTGGRDGIPVALMEAMASGCPVVSTRVSGIPELVEHEVTGLLATPGDANSLADCLADVLANPSRADVFARRARAKIELDFDLTKEARKLHAAMARSVR